MPAGRVSVGHRRWQANASEWIEVGKLLDQAWFVVRRPIYIVLRSRRKSVDRRQGACLRIEKRRRQVCTGQYSERYGQPVCPAQGRDYLDRRCLEGCKTAP